MYCKTSEFYFLNRRSEVRVFPGPPFVQMRGTGSARRKGRAGVPPATMTRLAKRLGVVQWVVVLAVGVIVVAIVLGLKLIPRLNDGQKVLARDCVACYDFIRGGSVGIEAAEIGNDSPDGICR